MTGERKPRQFRQLRARPLAPLLTSCCCESLLRPAIFSGSAAPLSRRAAPLVAPRSSLLVAAASSSPLASLRRWASLRLCDAALNADPHPVLMDAGLLALFLSLLPLPFLLAAALSLYRRSSSPPLFAASPRFAASLLSLPFYAVRGSAAIFSVWRLSLPFSAPFCSSSLSFARALRSCEGINRRTVRVRVTVWWMVYGVWILWRM